MARTDSATLAQHWIPFSIHSRKVEATRLASRVIKIVVEVAEDWAATGC